MGDAGNPTNGRRPRAARVLERLAHATFALYLILLLGGNSVAEAGGPPAWLPLVSLPAAGGQWVGIGIVALLPPLSVLTWQIGRALGGPAAPLVWRPARLSLPLLALGGLGLLSLARLCLTDACDMTAMARLALLLIHLGWVYLYVLNARPPLFGVIVAVLLLQGTVGLGQFLQQRDLGLRLLGETPLDPQVAGVSVVMRGGERWLRAYGLTPHPNSLARLLVPMLLLAVVLGPQPARSRRLLLAAAATLGLAALFATLARWAAVCLLLGLGVGLGHWLLSGLGRGRWSPAPLDRLTLLAPALAVALLLAVYGDAVVGRAVALETPLESRSIEERERDATIALRLLAEHPLGGVGLGRYLPIAQGQDAAAVGVHAMPLLLGAELGLAGVAVWAWLAMAPLWRPYALTRFAPLTGLWLGYWLLGLFYPGPDPVAILRDALLTGLVAGVVALSFMPDVDVALCYRRPPAS